MSMRIERFDRLPETARIDRNELQELVHISRQTVWRHVRSGRLPKPVRLGAANTWEVGAVRRYLRGETQP
jgi:predicted DNA-binding transcriptional regulator AlpA